MPSRTATTTQANPFADPLPNQAPPPPPPKQPTLRHSPARPQPSSRTSNDIMSPVRDTVASRSPDHAPRARPSRSQTAATQPPPPTRPSNAQRSMSSDSALRPADKARHHKPKKASGSMHADVIDRLDFSGVGPMFHHDGPFDACAPSRNRHRQKAPMYAWTGVNPEDEQAYREKEGFTGNNISPAKVPQSPYYDDYEETPRKKVDAIAEAWGIHEPEPFEDFSAGGGDRNGDSAPGSRVATYSRRERQRRDIAEEPPRGKTSRRPMIPPPQPIFIGDEQVAEEAYPPSPNANGHLGRNKSLMQRIRKMRDAPNVPVGYDDNNGNVSPTSSGEGAGGYQGRPTQRAQNSFLGRFGKNGQVSPDSYVYVDDPKSKDLPPPPEETPSPSAEGPGGYFDPHVGGGGNGLGRKGSLMRKMRGVVNRK